MNCLGLIFYLWKSISQYNTEGQSQLKKLKISHSGIFHAWAGRENVRLSGQAEMDNL